MDGFFHKKALSWFGATCFKMPMTMKGAFAKASKRVWWGSGHAFLEKEMGMMADGGVMKKKSTISQKFQKFKYSFCLLCGETGKPHLPATSQRNSQRLINTSSYRKYSKNRREKQRSTRVFPFFFFFLLGKSYSFDFVFWMRWSCHMLLAQSAGAVVALEGGLCDRVSKIWTHCGWSQIPIRWPTNKWRPSAFFSFFSDQQWLSERS